MRLALLSPYHGGSHAAWAGGLTRHLDAEVRPLTLPARFWKWRMHGGAVTLARRFEAEPQPDLLLATDMLDLTTFLALTRKRTARLPVLLYMHENQLTYPLPDDASAGPMRRQHGERDRHYGFVNLASMLAADRVAFNSAFHRDSVLAELPRFLRHFPEQRELGAVDLVRERSVVLPVGIDGVAIQAEAADIESDATVASAESPPLLLWNQRWEYDKRPQQFFAALERLAASGRDFRVALCGERFERVPEVFERGIAGLGERVEHVGFLPREEYVRLLRRADVVLSTAAHEFFGISVLEAIAAGALPVLPHALAYPELVPEALHPECLYDDEERLDVLLARAVDDGSRRRSLAARLAREVATRFDWSAVAPAYEAALAELAAGASALDTR